MKLIWGGLALVLLQLTILHAPAVADDGYWDYARHNKAKVTKYRKSTALSEAQICKASWFLLLYIQGYPADLFRPANSGGSI